MKVLTPFALVLAFGVGLASPPPRPDPVNYWHNAIEAARADLAACTKPAITAKLHGDVTIEVDDASKKWSTSSAKALGTQRAQLEKCMRDALAKRYKPGPGDDGDFRLGGKRSHTVTIGKPIALLPPPKTLLPIWRRAVSSHASEAQRARGELEKLVPPDHTLTKDACFTMDRPYAESWLNVWLEVHGNWVPRMWEKEMAQVAGGHVHVAMWDPAGAFVLQGPKKGLCLLPFDGANQTALRQSFDKRGTCWVGGFEDILLHPRVAFPTEKKYTQVSVQTGRACAVSTAGDVTCCGPTEPALPAAPSTKLASVSLGYGHACGLDANGNATCWGDIDPAPKHKFTRLSSHYQHTCGVTKAGAILCWGKGNYDTTKPPKASTFVDVTASSFSSCGLHKDGSVQCWGEPSRAKNPPGKFKAIAATWTHGCGVRKDGTVGCWTNEDYVVDTMIPDKLVDVTVADASYFCGRRADQTVACWGGHPPIPDSKLAPPTTAKLVQLHGDRELVCGVRDDGAIDCWGDLWPGTWLGDNTYPYARVLGLTGPQPAAVVVGKAVSLKGRVVDETGAPIAGAEVLVCSTHGPCINVERDAQRSPDTLASLIGKIAKPYWKSDSYLIATTAADGGWTGTLTPDLKDYNARYQIVATASGREVAKSEVSVHEPAKLARDIVLRPASSLELVPRCGKRACTGKLTFALAPYNSWFTGTRAERLSPGTYTIHVQENRGEVNGRTARVFVDVTFTANTLKVPVTLQPSGTGKSIRGTAKLDGATKGVRVMAKCKGRGTSVVHRRTVTDEHGNYELADVGAPPCEVSLESSDRTAVTVDKLPAKNIDLDGAAIRPPRRR